AQLDQFARAGDAGDQHQPGIVGVVHQAQVTQLEAGQWMGVGGELRVQFVGCGVVMPGHDGILQRSADSKNASVRLRASAALAAWKWRGSTSRLKAWPAPG